MPVVGTKMIRNILKIPFILVMVPLTICAGIVILPFVLVGLTLSYLFSIIGATFCYAFGHKNWTHEFASFCDF